MRVGRMLVVAGVALAIGLPPVMGSDDTTKKMRTIRGQVIEMRSVATANRGNATEIRVQTRQREQVWLRLGPMDGGQFQVGDQVRARVRDGAGGPMSVKSVWNQTTDQVLAAKAGDTQVLQDRDRIRDRIHDQTGDRTRLRTPDQDRVRQRDRLSRPGGGFQSGHRRGVRD